MQKTIRGEEKKIKEQKNKKKVLVLKKHKRTEGNKDKKIFHNISN